MDGCSPLLLEAASLWPDCRVVHSRHPCSVHPRVPACTPAGSGLRPRAAPEIWESSTPQAWATPKGGVRCCVGARSAVALGGVYQALVPATITHCRLHACCAGCCASASGPTHLCRPRSPLPLCLPARQQAATCLGQRA